MDLKIYNKNLEYEGVIDTYESLIWIRKYSESGHFELHTLLNYDTLNLLKRDNLIIKDSEVAYIDYRAIKQDDAGKETLIVYGKMASAYLDRRIIWEKKVIDNIEQGIRELIDENVINPSVSNRKINNFVLGELKNFSSALKKQVSHKNLLEEVENLAHIGELGFFVSKNSDDKLEFNIYQGIDRRSSQEINSPAIFSRTFDNILEQEYTETKRNYKNTALVAGEGEGANRILEVIESGQDVDRYEIFVDAKDLRQEGMSEIEYRQLLRGRGESKLAELYENYTFDALVDTNSNLEYKKDFDLGDKVTILNKKWGVKLDVRINEVTEIYEESGFRLEMVFGNNIPKLIKKIKQEVNTWQ